MASTVNIFEFLKNFPVDQSGVDQLSVDQLTQLTNCALTNCQLISCQLTNCPLTNCGDTSSVAGPSIRLSSSHAAHISNFWKSHDIHSPHPWQSCSPESTSALNFFAYRTSTFSLTFIDAS